MLISIQECLHLDLNLNCNSNENCFRSFSGSMEYEIMLCLFIFSLIIASYFTCWCSWLHLLLLTTISWFAKFLLIPIISAMTEYLLVTLWLRDFKIYHFFTNFHNDSSKLSITMNPFFHIGVIFNWWYFLIY